VAFGYSEQMAFTSGKRILIGELSRIIVNDFQKTILELNDDAVMIKYTKCGDKLVSCDLDYQFNVFDADNQYIRKNEGFSAGISKYQ
jgi:glycosylphosphatidylinositol transamidase (GPIT) subunit GPI8